MRVLPGTPHPLGATWDGRGVNFALYSAHADAVELLFFDDPDDTAPAHVVALERTGPVWHAYLPLRRPGQLYGYRVHGPWAPRAGHRFNPHKVVLDPYAKALGRPYTYDDSLYDHRRRAPRGPLDIDRADSAAKAPLARVVDDVFQWADDARPNVPLTDTVVYEAHVKGLTMQHPDVERGLRGTYLGLASEPILEHLKSIGVTSVQLMPVHACADEVSLTRRGMTNYWGYNPLALFAPDPRFAAFSIDDAVLEFKMMVRALHAAGLEVLIDVVFNHSCEGDERGPTLSLRGIDNASYYKHDPEDPSRYLDFTGCGNTLDLANPYVLHLVTDCLRYWAEQMRVDGFRFDLTSALARDAGDVDMLAGFFKVIQQDPVLSRTKLIAEPWDASPGGYKLGQFPWYWAEWNGKFRDCARQFWRGDTGHDGEMATRLSGSSDLYRNAARRPSSSVNFVTAHDGFTLQDLVSYKKKHNEPNGEANRDGLDENFSDNCGAEGDSDDPAVRARRLRLRRALIATTLLAQGTPLLSGGDENSRTQGGNNNAYCIDDERTWTPWQLDEEAHSFLDFVQELAAFRRAHPTFRRRSYLTGEPDRNGVRDVVWWHPAGREMTPEDWDAPTTAAFAMQLAGRSAHEHDVDGRPLDDDTFLLVLAPREDLTFQLPPPPAGHHWLRVLDTAAEDAPRREAGAVAVVAPSLVVFEAAPS